MKYLLLICSDGIPAPEKAAVMQDQVPAWIAEMTARDVRSWGHALQSAQTAKTVRVRDGQTLVSDGPFTESKEFVAGFDLIDAADLDEAIEVASKHPVAQFHCVEVRPLMANPLGEDSDEFPLFKTAGELPGAERLAGPAPGKQRHLLLMCVNGIPETDAEEEQIMRDAHSWLERVTESGTQVFGHGLTHADTATTVRVRDGETLLSDGPFVEAKEFIGGFDVVDCETLEEAIELAAAHPLARYHRVEVRRFAQDTRDR